MVETAERTRTTKRDSFEQLTDRILSLIEAGHAEQIGQEVEGYTEGRGEEGHKLLLRGVCGFSRRDYEGAVELMGQANELLKEDQRPSLNSIYSQVLVKSQEMLPRRRRPVTARGRGYFEGNVAALREVDSVLAEEVAKTAWPREFVLLDYWGGHHLCYTLGQGLLQMDEQVKKSIDEHIKSRNPFGFFGIASGQEICYSLANQFHGLHGMSRVHYVFEKKPERIAALLHLRDFSRELRDFELIILGGASQEARIKEIFGSYRYPSPYFTIEAEEKLSGYVEQIRENMDASGQMDRAKEYYRSAEFGERQKRIAAGEVKPRIVVFTCRWTTFLKHCAADFARAFGELGCESRFLIEESDVQVLTDLLHWRELDQFRPDVMFGVSHGRPSFGYLPRELPFISYVQDKCGPILELSDLGGHISEQDLFVCMVGEFERYLRSKNVEKEQTYIMPIPADESMFYPLSPDDSRAGKYTVDVSFVNHGNFEPEKLFEKFLQDNFGREDDDAIKNKLISIFTELFRLTCHDVDTCRYEDEMQEFVLGHLSSGAGDEVRHGLSRLVTTFYITVYALACRSQFMEELDRAGVDLALYGNGWERNSRLKHRARGPVGRGEELNLVYNFSRINLSINPAMTMHQRLSECGLAGGFMMVADHPAEKDWASAREFFEEDKEIAFFKTRKELIEKYRYYLAHEDERREIGENMYQRALRERTCRAGGETILRQWRRLLSAKR